MEVARHEVNAIRAEVDAVRASKGVHDEVTLETGVSYRPGHLVRIASESAAAAMTSPLAPLRSTSPVATRLARPAECSRLVYVSLLETTD